MSSHEQDRNQTQRGQDPAADQRQDRDLDRGIHQDANQAGQAGQTTGQTTGQNPGQSLSPYQQGQKGVDAPIQARGQPQRLFAQGGYGSQEVHGQEGAPYALGSAPRDDGRRGDPSQGAYPDGQGNGARFGGTWGGPDRGQAWGAPQAQALTEGWGDQGQAPRHPDRHYHAWRDRQNRQFDEDWDAFNRERQSAFDDEFETWRSSRAAKGTVVAATPVSPEGSGSDKDS